MLFKDKQPKDDQVLPYTRQRREDHPTLIRPPTGPCWQRRRRRQWRRWCYNDRNFVAQEQPTASCGLYVLCGTTQHRRRRRGDGDGAAMATASATAKLLPPFKSHFEVYYASADRSLLTRKSMQRKRKQKACRTFLGQTKCCKCTIINGNETNFPSFFENNLLETGLTEHFQMKWVQTYLVSGI